MTIAEISTNRLEKILSKDKRQNPEQILPMLESDISSLLQNYLTLKNLEAKFEVQNGEYVLNFQVRASQIKQVGIIA